MTKNEKELAEINCSYQYEGGYHDGYEAAMATIVRCKDCVYYQRASTQAVLFKCDYFSSDEVHLEVITDEDDYCSGGVRRENE